MIDFYGKDISKLKNKKLWLLDMDGTIYLGNKVFEGTHEFLANVIKKGNKYVFITNNSSKNNADYVEKLRTKGITAKIDDFYTSTDASISLLKKRFGNQLIYAQGTKSFIKSLKDAELNVTTEYNENSSCVIVAYDTELTEEKLSNTFKSLLHNVAYYATNPDWVCPTEFGYVPDCGSMCFGIEKATGKKPIFIGKPNALMINEALKKYNVKKEDAVVVGDRLYTDIASGINAEVDTVLVLSGETTINDFIESKEKPTFVLNSIADLKELLK